MSTRLAGHALAHVANRADMTWVWECECGVRQQFVAPSKKVAVAEHRAHKDAVRDAAHGEEAPNPEGHSRDAELQARALDFPPST